MSRLRICLTWVIVSRMSNLRTLIPTREVADRLGKSTRYVTRLVDAGALKPAAKAPGPRGAFLFDEDEVRAYIKERAA